MRRALLACNNADRAYLRRWIVQWIDDRGRINPEAEAMPTQGIDEYRNTVERPEKGR